jgi:hypothetical protein
MGGSGEGQLGVTGALSGFISAEFKRNPFKIFVFTETGSDERIMINELAEVSKNDRRISGSTGDGNAIAGAYLMQRRPPERAFQVYVQVGLGQQGQVTHGSIVIGAKIG